MTTIDVRRLTEHLDQRYQVERQVGEGGMATVYLARDLRHGRAVAIKVLKPDLAAVLGTARFLAEIRTTASLQHPHILPLHDSGEAGGFLYYVMPFVEGESLRDRLDRETQLPIDDALTIAEEVADALAYAHGHGIIHRDIKPANILLQGGHALVTDFGIALALETAGGDRVTQSGISIGTPRYMSPEQATGEKAIDARTDIYALGVVTYEMLAGDSPFRGPTSQVVIAKVLTEKPPPPSTLRDTVSPQLDATVLRAIAKLPADRFSSASDFRRAITLSRTGDAVGPVARPSRSRVPVLMAGVAAAMAASFAIGRLTLTRPSGSTFGGTTQVTWEPGVSILPALSPDGKVVAYAAGDGIRSKIFVRPVAGGRAIALTDDSTTVESAPQWSHDGTRILFLSNQQVFSAPSGGGPSRQEVPNRSAGVTSATWSPDEREIAYVIGDSVFLRDDKGQSKSVAALYQPNLCTWGPRTLVACTGGNPWYLQPGIAFGNIAPSWIAVVDVATGRVRSVTDTASSNAAPAWGRDGHTLFFVSNRFGPRDLFAVDIDAQGGAAGQPRRLTTGLSLNSLSFSADGSRMAYPIINSSSSVWSVPWNGGAPQQSTRPTQVTFGRQTIEFFSVSSDGEWVYYDSDISGNEDLYRLHMPNGEPERLTSAQTVEFSPDISRDGREVAFHSWRTGSRDIFVLPLDGGPLAQVTDTPIQEQQAAWSPDGSSIASGSQSEPLGLFISHRDASGKWTTRKIADNGHFPSWSPDGRYLSFTTAILGGGLRVIAADGGAVSSPYDEHLPGAPLAEVSRWSADGRTVYFRTHTADGHVYLMAVPPSGGTPRRVYEFGDSRLKSDRYGFRIVKDRLYFTMSERQGNVWVMDVRP